MGHIQDTVALIAGDYIDKENCTLKIEFLNYLVDANVSLEKLAILYEKGWLERYNQLPKDLWEESLLRPYTYYYHTHLQRLSPPCIFDPKTGAFTKSESYNEMRIILTPEQVIEDMYFIVGTLPEFQHAKRDIEGLKYILEKHRISLVGDKAMQTIDVIYMLFDQAKKSSIGPRSNFLNLFEAFYNNCLSSIEEMHIQPQNKFLLRTGELVTCAGK